MGTTDSMRAVLDRFKDAPTVRLIGGPWDGKELSDMSPNSGIITVLVGHDHHEYAVSQDRLTANWSAQ